MAHMLFDGLNGVSLDNHTVQSILDSTTLSGAGPPTTVTLDEEDVFQCGKCKKQFTSFSLFMCHKKEHTTAADHSQESEATDSTRFQQLEVQALNNPVCTTEMCQSMILGDADILSFSIDDDEALRLTNAVQDVQSDPNIENENSYLMSDSSACNGYKQQPNNATSCPDANNFITSVTSHPIILTSETVPDSFAPLVPVIESVSSLAASNSCSENVAQNVNVLATCPERQPKSCKVLLPNIDYVEESATNGTLLLEYDKVPDKLLQYGNGSVGSDGTVLLDYCNGDERKTCKVLLTNGEYADTSIEYVDGTNQICEFSDFAVMDGNEAEAKGGSYSLNLLDVIHPPNGSSITFDLANAISSEEARQICDDDDENLPLALANKIRCTLSEVDTLVDPLCRDSSTLCGVIDQCFYDQHMKEYNRPINPKPPKLKCHYCEKMFYKNFDLQQHLRSHTGEKPFQCVVCGRAFSQKSNVKKHMATHKVWPNVFSSTLPKEPLQILEKCSGDKKKKDAANNEDKEDSIIVIDRSYVCQYCNTSFTSYFELKTHMKDHSHQKVYKCIQQNCAETFEDLDLFLDHTKEHSNEVQYCCHVCCKKFDSLADLGMHQYTHNPDNENNPKNQRYFRCVKCKSKFTSSKALDHHLSTTNHHFPCSHCGKIFSCERYLRRHLPTHGAPENFLCATCGKGFRTEQYLNIHRLIHSGVKPFACLHCPAAFNRKDKLTRHSLTHQPAKKFKCPFQKFLGCSKEFNRQDKLKLHVLTHNAVKPFTCKHCNKAFNKQTQLKDHELSHYSRKSPFACVTCGLRFKKKVHLSTHPCCENADAIKLEKSQLTTSEGKFPDVASSKVSRNRRKKTRNKRARSSTLHDKNVPGSRDSEKIIAPPDSSSSSIGENYIFADSVPTIEIIVLPMSTKQAEEEKNMYQVVFPAVSKEGEMQSNYIHSEFSNGLRNSSPTVPD